MEQLIVNKKDLEYNINVVKNYLVEQNQSGKIPKIIGVVKANGYGMGLVELSNEYILKGIDMLAVSKIEEAVKLRENNVYCDILFLSSTAIEMEAQLAVKNNIIPTIGSIDSLKVYEKVAKQNNEKIDVHIKIETGFSRHGISMENVGAFLQEYSKCENINIVGVFTHFIEAFSNSSILVQKQYGIFESVVNILKQSIDFTDVMLHVCNSSATFKYPKYHLDAVRVGSAFIGSLPFKNNYGLKKIGYLQMQISEIKNIKKGSSIGYGTGYIAQNDMTIGIVQSGYTSGIGLKIENNTFRFVDFLREVKRLLIKCIKKEKIQCYINDKRYDVVSNIRMNNIFVDITNSNVKIGDIVKLNIYPSIVDSSIQRKYV